MTCRLGGADSYVYLEISMIVVVEGVEIGGRSWDVGTSPPPLDTETTKTSWTGREQRSCVLFNLSTTLHFKTSKEKEQGEHHRTEEEFLTQSRKKWAVCEGKENPLPVPDPTFQPLEAALTVSSRLGLPVNLRGPVAPLSRIKDLGGPGPHSGAVLGARDQVFIPHVTIQRLCVDFVGRNLRNRNSVLKQPSKRGHPLGVRPGMQTFPSYIALLTSGVVPDLVQHVAAHGQELAVFFIHACPGEVVVGGVVALVETAGRVGFNCTCS